MIEFPTLYKKAKNGKITQWTVSVDTDPETGYPCITRISGYYNGKLTTTKRLVKRGTNPGKANQKTPMENAEFIAGNYWKGQIEANFVESIDEALNADTPKQVYPMLAQKFDASKMVTPCYVQPKLNGVRCISYRHLGQTSLMSRRNREFTTIDHIKEEVGRIFGEFSPDGELYCHGVPLQTIISWVKRRQQSTEKIKYVVYDLAVPFLMYKERYQKIVELFEKYEKDYGRKPQFVEYLAPKKVSDLAELEETYREYVGEGYEGLIYRNPNGFYGFNDRVVDLMKYKNFQDDEFEIVGAIPERYYDKTAGVFRDLVIWICKTQSDNTFHCRPIGSAEEKELWYKERYKYIGKKLTVRYLELSIDGTPVGNPVGIIIRDYE